MIERRWAVPYIALATHPTVTLPRIKALTTGADPGFFDVFVNLGAPDQSQLSDSWLHRFKHEKNSSIVFYGDETWLKLFGRDMFDRYEGTTSFFVAVSRSAEIFDRM